MCSKVQVKPEALGAFMDEDFEALALFQAQPET